MSGLSPLNFPDIVIHLVQIFCFRPSVDDNEANLRRIKQRLLVKHLSPFPKRLVRGYVQIECFCFEDTGCPYAIRCIYDVPQLCVDNHFPSSSLLCWGNRSNCKCVLNVNWCFSYQRFTSLRRFAAYNKISKIGPCLFFKR